MLRSVTLGVALPVIVAACALVEPPAPPGTYAVQMEVRNEWPKPVPFTVSFDDQPRADAVRPPSVPGGPSSTIVTFYLPVAGNWGIDIGEPGEDFGGIGGTGIEENLRPECQPVIELKANRQFDFSGCH